MLDPFDTPVIPGFSSAPDFLGADEERALIRAIDRVDLTPFQFLQWEGKRLTNSYGWSYDFQTGALSRAEPIPDWLGEVRDRAATFAGLRPADIVQALVIRYDPGAGIGWHKDRPIYEHVIGCSLGAPAEMRFRRKDGARWQRATVPLEPRGIYHLAGEVRNDWEHSILPLTEPRWSITMRSFAAAGRAKAERIAHLG
jgi:DNA oxidative demethylase